MTVDNIAALSAAATTDSVFVRGYNTPGDGGGGTFFWDAASTEAEDGGTIFGAGTGRWKRIYGNDAINVLWFGVTRGSGMSDQSVPFNKAVDALPAGGTLIIPPGTYTLTKLIRLKSNMSVQGSGAILDGGSEATLYGEGVTNVSLLPGLTVKNTGTYCIFFKQSSDIRIQGITCIGNTSSPAYAGDGICFYNNSGISEKIWIADCHIKSQSRNAITIEVARDVHITNNYLQNCRGGIHFEGAQNVVCNGNTIDDCGNNAYGNPAGYFYPVVLSVVDGLQFVQNTFLNNINRMCALVLPSKNVTLSDNKGLPSLSAVAYSNTADLSISDFNLINNDGGSIDRDSSQIATKGRFNICNNRNFGGVDLDGFDYALIQNNTGKTGGNFDIRAYTTVANSHLEVSGNVHSCRYYGFLRAGTVVFEHNTFTVTYADGYPAYVGYRFEGDGRIIARGNKGLGFGGYQLFFNNPAAQIELHNNSLTGSVAFNNGSSTITSDMPLMQLPSTYRMSHAPTIGTYEKGALVFNTDPATSTPLGWVCQAAGSPGTWAPFSTL